VIALEKREKEPLKIRDKGQEHPQSGSGGLYE
jgi:hypothetical protein